jgi:hypothetical protein
MERIEYDWPGHFIGAKDCKFFRTTHVNGWRVSTVGEYRPRGCEEGPPEHIGLDRYYETMVFPLADAVCSCGCGAHEVRSWSNEDFDAYQTESGAAAGHEAMVRRYAKITPTPEGQGDE